MQAVYFSFKVKIFYFKLTDTYVYALEVALKYGLKLAREGFYGGQKNCATDLESPKAVKG